MVNCSKTAKKIGVVFSKNIRTGVATGRVNVDEVVTSLASGLSTTTFNPIAIAHVIHGSMKMSIPASIGLADLTEVSEIEAYVAQHQDPDPNKVADNLSKLSAVRGFGTFDETVQTLSSYGNNDNIAIAEQLSVYTNKAKATNEEGVIIDPDMIIIDTLTADNTGTEMLKRKSSRILKTRGLKESSPDFWTPFLSTYFPGMSGIGSEFADWAKDKFYASLIDNTDSMGGFIYDINDAINAIKKEAQDMVLNSVVKYTTTELNSAVLNNSEDVKYKYFYEVLATDFDFILNNMVKSITVSAKDTKTANSVVSGFMAENGEILNAKVLNIESIKHLFTHANANKFSLAGATSYGAVIPNIINKVDYDSHSFENAVDLANNAFYFTSIDEKYFYRDSKGGNIDITPISFYSYNSASKRNQNSFDPFIGALDSDSTFIHNLFQMFKTIKKDPENRTVYGERMTVIDFLTVAPYLTNAGRTLEEFTVSLTELASLDTPAGRVANTLLVNVFSPVATRMGNNQDVYSIYQATQKDAFERTSINHQIVKALHNALINKDNVRYLKVEEGITSITRGLDSGTPSETVNTELAGILTIDGYTKNDIAKMLTVTRGEVNIRLTTSKGSVMMTDIKDMTTARSVALATGLIKEFDRIHKKFTEVYPIDKADAGTVSVLTNLINVAAVNKRENALAPSVDPDRIFLHPNYNVMSPSTIILGEELDVLASLYNVDSHKSISVGGSLTASTSTPNRDSSITAQIKQYDHYNNWVNVVKFTFNPFLASVSDTIPRAVYSGQVLKTPMVVSGDAIKLSSWDVKVRTEHAMVQGFLQAPKNIGREFFLQPINYSDKSNIPLHKITFEEDNLLEPGDVMKEKLITAYIEYQTLKNEELQRVTLHHFKEFVVGNFDSILLGLNLPAGDAESRKDALYKLRVALLDDFSSRQGDMTKEINELLATVKIHPDTIKYADSELDAGADYVSFDGNPNTAIIKPHLGVRAALYRDPVKARKEVQDMLSSHRQSMVSLKMDADRLEIELAKASKKDKAPSIVSDANELYDRFFLINGIYGHALKTLTMGDESYFSARYPKGMSIEGYYAEVVNGERFGLEESEKMLVGQFKRAQSELTRGNAYSQKDTLEGLKRRHRKDNLLSYLNIYGDNVVHENVGTKSMPNNIFEFETLQGKTLTELEGLGVISRFENGDLISESGLGILVKFNVGNDQIIIGDYRTSVYDLKDNRVDHQLVDAMFALLKSSIETTKNSPSESSVTISDVIDPEVAEVYRSSDLLMEVGTEQQYQGYVNSINENSLERSVPGSLEESVAFQKFKDRQTLLVEKSTMTHGITRGVAGRETALTLDAYMTEVEKISKNNFVVMPDLIPSITISDPISYINLLNSMGNTQENSDAIQFMHPLMSLIMEEARGGVLGAFNTENQEALKLLTTTFEYDRMRQVLQKKSVQMPFTDEQMRKLGSVELYNTLKKMNTAIRFKKPEMTLFETVANRGTVSTFTANNLHELYDQVMKSLSASGTDAGHEVPDSIVWRRVMEILRQNPINMYNFVGLISVPSNQKTGHKKLNRYENIFSQTENKDKPNIDYTANEYNYEVLTKAHSYDVTGEMHEASSLTLLSQLVNAVSFGGLSNLTTKNLQNAMGGKMAINSLRVGKDLANIAAKLKIEDGNPLRFNKIIERLNKGDVSTFNLKPEEIDAFNTVLRAGVYEMANLAFQKSDSLLIHKIIKGENMLTDADGNVVMESGVYSMDSPAVRSKVMGTLRSAFFEDTVKMKMSGFIGTVSATHKTINIFTLPSGLRVGREGYIKGALEQGLPEGSEGRRVIISAANQREIKTQILPFDDVHVTKNGVTSTMRFGSVTDAMFADPKILVVGILTPDILYSSKVDHIKFDLLDANTLIRITTDSGKKIIHYKWYITETYSADEISSMITKAQLEEDITERFSLRWYDYTRESEDGKIINLKSSDAYRNFYRAAVDEVSEEELDSARALLILETQSKDAEGKAVWSATTPEVVLPTYMGKAFGIPKGVSVTSILGTNGEPAVNAAKYFDSLPGTEATFTILTGTQAHYKDQLIRIYSRKLVLENNSFDQEVLDYLNSLEDTENEVLSNTARSHINELIKKARVKHTVRMAKSFISTLEVALTRIPGQSKQSAFMGNVVELLDAQGNATFAPTDHLVNTGGDMDIDTLSVLTKSIDSSGMMYDFSSFITDDKGFSIKDMTDQYVKDLEFTEEKIRKLARESNERSEEYINNRKAKLLTQKTPEMIREVTRQIGFAEKLPFTKEKIEQLVEQSRRKVFARYENLLANAIADGVFRSLDNIDTAVELNTPISMGMFDAIIKRIEAHNELNNKLNTTVSIRRDYKWSVLKDEGVFSSRGVNVMNTSKKKAAHKHFGNPFSGTGAEGLIHVGKHLMTKEEYALPENEDKRLENMKTATDMYKTWLESGKSSSLFEEINGYTLDLSEVAPLQKEWIKLQIADGKLDGAVLLDMRESGTAVTHANVLANIAGTRLQGPRSGEDYRVIFEYENLNAQGKEAIGIFATTLKINSALQSAKINYDTNYKHSGRMSYENPFFFKNSIEYVDFETNQTEERSRSGFADLDRFNISQSVSKSTALQRTIAKLINGDTYNRTSVETLTNLLGTELESHLDMSEYAYTSKEATDLMTVLSKSLFNITLPNEVINSDDPINAFKLFLRNYPKLVSKAYIEVIGKQLSNDAQSQFLSAATDNAKELILGKIKSNQLTNPIMTAMMILGYDTKTTIDFLYDPTISAVLDAFADKVSNLETVSITKKSIEKAGFDVDSPSISSLISILKIGEEIAKFRSIRSLNENAQIEQYKLDRILGDLDADVLYQAIVEDNIDLIKSSSEAQGVFNPNLMVFLHPQSRYLFRSVYESEKFKMPSLFKVVDILFAMSGKNSRNMASYKNISSYLSQFQVERYLNQSSPGTNKEGEPIEVFRTGAVVTKDPELGYVTENYALNLPANRAKFVKNFESYIEYAKETILGLQGSENAALSNLGRGNTYNSTNTVFYFPKLKNTNIDSLDTSLIHEGINELKIKTGNVELDKFQRKVYNNLSLYALIVSSGEIRKSSMIEAFEEINLGLSKFLTTLKKEDYDRAIPETEFIKDIIKGEVLYRDEVIQKSLDDINRAKSAEEREEEDAYMELYNEPEEVIMEDVYEFDASDGVDGFQPKKTRDLNQQSKEVRKIYLGSKTTSGKVFKVLDPSLRGDIFYAYRPGEIAYRIFPSEASEALPVTTIPGSIDFKKLDKTVVRELGMVGMQFGLSAVYGGTPVRILAYKGLENRAEHYIVAHDNGTMSIPGVHLMEENPDILLIGNIIQPITGRNRRRAIDKKTWNEGIIARVPNVMTSMDTSVNIAITGLFTNEDIHRDFIVSRESRVLGAKGGAYDVLNLSDANSVSYTPSYEAYLKSPDVKKSNRGSVSTLIPAIYTDIVAIGEIADTNVVSEMMSQVVDMLNNTEVDSEITFFGIDNRVDFTKKGNRVAVGGIDLLDRFLKPFRQKRRDGTETLLNNSFEITRSYDEPSDIHKVTIRRTKNNGGLVMINESLVHVATVVDSTTKAVKAKEWLGDQVKVKALVEGIIEAPYKTFFSGINNKRKEVIAVRTSEDADGYEMFYKESAKGYNDKYVKLHSTPNKDGIFDTDRNNYYMLKSKYDAILENTKNENNELINPGC